MTLVPELEELRGQVDQISREATALCDALSEQELGWRPEPGRWSIAENLVHLSTTSEVFLPSLDAAIAEAKQKSLRSDGPFKLTMMGRIYKWYVEPPPVIRLPSPKVLRPVVTGPAAEALPLFLESQRRLAARIEAANGLDLNRVRWTSPLTKLVRMDLLTIFNVANGHARRHIWQASKVRMVLPSSRQRASSAPH